MPEVKTKGDGPGRFVLSLGADKVVAERQPDKYFQIELDGTKHKDYLKNLKAVFAAWVERKHGGVSQVPGSGDAGAGLRDAGAGRAGAQEVSEPDPERAVELLVQPVPGVGGGKDILDPPRLVRGACGWKWIQYDREGSRVNLPPPTEAEIEQAMKENQ